MTRGLDTHLLKMSEVVNGKVRFIKRTCIRYP